MNTAAGQTTASTGQEVKYVSHGQELEVGYQMQCNSSLEPAVVPSQVLLLRR